MNIRRMVFVFGMFVLILALAAPAFAAEKIWIDVAGIVTYKNEKNEVVQKRITGYRDVHYTGGVGGDLGKKLGHFRCYHDKVEKQIPVDKIKKITLNLKSKDGVKGRHDDLTAKVYNVTLTNAAGEVFHVFVNESIGFSLTGTPYVQFKFQDEITGGYTIGYILSNTIEEVAFTSEPKVSTRAVDVEEGAEGF